MLKDAQWGHRWAGGKKPKSVAAERYLMKELFNEETI